MGEVKPGYKTTEFWSNQLTKLAAGILSVLAMFGVFNAEEAGTITEAAKILIPLIVPVVIGLLAVIDREYTQARTHLKSQAASIEGEARKHLP